MLSLHVAPVHSQNACYVAARHWSAGTQRLHGSHPAVALHTASRCCTTPFRGARGAQRVATRAKEAVEATSGSDAPSNSSSSSSKRDSSKKQPSSRTSGQLFVEDEDGDMVINDEEFKRFMEQKGPWLMFFADISVFTLRQMLWLAPLLWLAQLVDYDVSSHLSWSLPALQVGLVAALPALALVAVQELGPWARTPDQLQLKRYVQLLEEVNESELVNQTDLDEVSSRRRLGEPGWPALAAGLDTFQRVNFTEGLEKLATMPLSLQVWEVFKEWARPALVPVAFKGLLLTTTASAILEQVAAHGTDTSGLFFWARLFGVANPVVALWLSVPAALLVLAPVQANLRFGQHNPYRIFTRLALLQLEVVGRLAPAMWLTRYSLQGTPPLLDDKGRAFTYRRGTDLMQQRRDFVLGDWAEQQQTGGVLDTHATATTSSSRSQQAPLAPSTSSSGVSQAFNSREAVMQEVQLRYQLLQKGLKGLDKRLADLAETQVQEETSRASSRSNSSTSSLEEDEEGGEAGGADKLSTSSASGGGRQQQQQQWQEGVENGGQQKEVAEDSGESATTATSSSSSNAAAASSPSSVAAAHHSSSGPAASPSTSNSSSGSGSHNATSPQHQLEQPSATGDTSSTVQQAAAAAAAAAAGGGGGGDKGAADAGGTASPNISTAVMDSAQRAVWDTALQVLENDSKAIYLVSMLEDVIVKEKDGQPVSLLQAAQEQRDSVRRMLEQYSDIVASASDTSDEEAGPATTTPAAAAAVADATAAVADATAAVTAATATATPLVAGNGVAANPSSSSSAASGHHAGSGSDDHRQEGTSHGVESDSLEGQQLQLTTPSSKTAEDTTRAAAQPTGQGASSSPSASEVAAGQRQQLESAMEGYLRGLYKAVVKDSESNAVLEDHAATVLAFAEAGRVSTAADAALVRWMVLVALLTDVVACGSYAATGGNLVAAGAAVTAVQLGQAGMRFIGLQRWVAAVASWPAPDSSDSSSSDDDA